jgi:hypothetical protein
MCRSVVEVFVQRAIWNMRGDTRSGYDLQPNVAARRLRWVEACERRRNPIGVEPDWIRKPRVTAAATLGWRS